LFGIIIENKPLDYYQSIKTQIFCLGFLFQRKILKKILLLFIIKTAMLKIIFQNEAHEYFLRRHLRKLGVIIQILLLKFFLTVKFNTMKSAFSKCTALFFALIFLGIACTKQQDSPITKTTQSTNNAATTTLPKPDHVVILILENHAYSQIIGSGSAPYINALATNSYSASFTKSYAIMHPSQPNYLCLYSGSNQGITDDSHPPAAPFTTPNLGRQLINAGKTFATYSQSLPSVGYNGDTYGAYARKHNPAANWMGTGKNQIPSTTNQPFTAFPTDYTKLPTVSIVVPNQNNDMHSGSISTSDTWVKNHLDSYVQWAKTHNSLFILTFDEDDDNHSNQIVTIFNGSMVKGGQCATQINHYNVLRTIEDMYGLTYAGKASTATPITTCWK
jgi:acid phosphatase